MQLLHQSEESRIVAERAREIAASRARRVPENDILVFNNNNNERIPRAPVHVKHAQLR